MTDAFTSYRIQRAHDLLASAGWCVNRFQWHPNFSGYDYNWLKAGDTILLCQREFETLIVVIHNDQNNLMQYHWAFNSQFESKGESVDYIKDFLAPFLATAQP